MHYENVENLEAYEVRQSRWIDELKSQALILRHKKTGARVFLLSNDDNNKVFTIGFRTPPEDSTGLPHILEHSTLCGSDKFPAKDPFVELMKGSLNTFLNAITYPDKTVYPVASCNDTDFQNLMDVYMDAVFHPNIRTNDKIFRQEGWHYEMEDADSPVVINGVVYNEMKGEYSQPESLLDALTRKVLYPDTCYAFDSGGEPEHIPELTQERFLAFYRKYYHPSNCYIYLYGDMDMAEKLTFLDREYLSCYEERETDSEITLQKPFEKPREAVFSYPIEEDDEEEDAAYLSESFVVGTDLDPVLYVAFQVLDYALLSAPGAPLKQVLLDAGIGDDVFGGYENGILQPFFTVIAKDTRADKKDEFLRLVDGELRRLAAEGIDKKSLEAALSYYEFKYREADYGQFPKGLMYGLQCFDSWLYDESDPLMHLAYADTFALLREKAGEGFFEELIGTWLLDNPHAAVITLIPERGLNEARDADLAARLAAYKKTLTAPEIDRMVADTEDLRRYQKEPTDPEILRMIPMLSREDLDRAVEPICYTKEECAGVPVIRSDIYTSGIGYMRFLFRIDAVADEDLPALGLLRCALGLLSTENYDYRDLNNEVLIETGGMSAGINFFEHADEPEVFDTAFDITVKAFYDKVGSAVSLLEEILMRSRLADEKRLREIVSEECSRMQMSFMGNGHSAAVGRASSYLSQCAVFQDKTTGIEFYKFMEDLNEHFDEEKEAVMAKLGELSRLVFTKENLLASYTADEDGEGVFLEALENFAEHLFKESAPAVTRNLQPEKKNEGFMIPSGVQYVAQCGDYRKAGLPFTGALDILKTILSYDYLWIELRTRGGAYGCMCAFHKGGDSYLVSYRDPHLLKTLEAYRGIPAYLRAFDVDEREMTKYIIGTVSSKTTPLTPAAKGNRALNAYLCHVTDEMRQKEMDEILDARVEDIRALAPYVEAILADECICVVGGSEKLKADGEGLLTLRNLFE